MFVLRSLRIFADVYSYFRSVLVVSVLCSGLSLSAESQTLSGEAGGSIELDVSGLFDLPPVVEIQTNLGNIPVELTPDVAPGTVENFLRYADADLYEDSFIHRSAVRQDGLPFVVQGGGFFFDFSGENAAVTDVPTFDPIVNEPNVSNVRGTVAMAKLGSDPDSATSQWFFNLSDNGSILDGQNGGFTVFGRVVGQGMDVVDAIAALTRYNLTQQLGSAFREVPLTDNVLNTSNFVTLSAVERLVPEVVEVTFPDGGAAYFNLSDANQIPTIEISPDTPPGDYRMLIEGATLGGTSQVVELILQISAAPAGPWYASSVDLGGGWRWFDWFGAFNVSNDPWIFHAEHGWLFPFADGPDDVYFWDSEMGSILWTSEPAYPSIYRFSDAQWLFYQKGSSNPRWFVNLLTGQWEQW